MSTYYELLNVNVSATSKDIRKAYYKMAIKLHPDKNPNNPEIIENFKKLVNAYEILYDPVERRQYDISINLRGQRYSSGKDSYEDEEEINLKERFKKEWFSTNQKVDLSSFFKEKGKFDWSCFADNREINMSFFEKMQTRVDWSCLGNNRKIDISF